MNIKLKPCPFCGAKGTAVKTQTLNGALYWVECRNAETCNGLNVRTKPFNNGQLAVEAWNRRAYDEQATLH